MAKNPNYVFTPARRAALAKARLRAIEVNKARGAETRRRSRRQYSNDPAKRGQGFAGLKRNFVPYARVNKGSGTGGFNVGTVIPGTGKRIVFGGYSRIETMNRLTTVDRMISKKANQLMPFGTKRGAVRTFWNKKVSINTPTVRVKMGGGEARLGTSRRHGPTLIFRKGQHKVVAAKTFGGTRRYKRKMNTIQNAKARTKKKPRRQRRGKR
jgi:hypothetical protein